MSTAGRAWLEVRVQSPGGEPEALVVEALLASGSRGVEERDGLLIAHFTVPDDEAAFLAELRRAVGGVAGADASGLEVSHRAHEDWAESWKQGLGARRLTDRIMVRPSWVAEPADRPEVTIVVDPGMAFGTAEHGTTRGCLRLLDRAVSDGDTVLDVGAGSGILAIAAALLGAGDVVAIEADELAWEALAENVEANGVADRVRSDHRAVEPDDVAGLGPVDGIVANIESGPLTHLMPGFGAAVREGGWLVLSGILAEEWADMVARAAAAGFTLEEPDADGEWRSGLFTRD